MNEGMSNERLAEIAGFLSDAAQFGDEYAVVGLELIAEVERLQAALKSIIDYEAWQAGE